MRPKERFAASIHGKPNDMVAFMELEFHIYQDFVREKLVIGTEYAALSSAEKQKALYHNAQVMVKTAQKAGHDAIRSIGGYWEAAPGEPAAIWLPDEEAQLGQLKALKGVGGEEYFILGTIGATMSIPVGNHFEEFCYALFDDPDGMKEAYSQIMDNALVFQAKQVEAGADGIVNAADIAFNTGPFISPEQCDEFVFPYLARWIRESKKQGVTSIWHTDGNLMPILDNIKASGVDAIQCVDPLAGMDIVEVQKEVDKKLALIGNIDCSILQFGPTEAIEEEVKRVVEGCKENGFFVLSACNAIFDKIPAAHYEAMVQARRKYGRLEI